MHTALIALHAASATLALLAGLWSWRSQRALLAHQVMLVTCIGALVGAVILDWGGLDPASRIVFGAFCGLGVAMVVVAQRARRAPATRRHWAIGFNLVSLTDGFVVIAVLDAGAGPALVIGSAVATAVFGHLVLRHAVRRSAGPEGAIRRPGDAGARAAGGASHRLTRGC